MILFFILIFIIYKKQVDIFKNLFYYNMNTLNMDETQ